MRRRGIRVFALIAVIVALAIATLSVRDIHIGGLDREGSGPLGLTLGLDLKGGSHLMYQADLPDQVILTFQDTVEESQLRKLLDDLGQTRADVTKREFSIRELALEEKAQGELREALEELIPIEAFIVSGDVLDVTFQDTLGEAEVRAVLDELGFGEATIQSSDQKKYTIGGLLLAERAQEELTRALEDELAPTLIEDFVVSGDVLDVTFGDTLDEADLRSVLDRIGYPEATIHSPEQRRYTILKLSLDETAQQKLRADLEELAPIVVFDSDIIEPTTDQMKGVVNTIQRRVNALGTTEPIIQRLGKDRVVVQLPGVAGSSIDVTFKSVLSTMAQIIIALEQMGHTEPDVEQSGPNSFVIRTEKPLTTEEGDALKEALAETLPPSVDLEVGDDGSEIDVAFPPLPDELTLNALLVDLGFTDYTIQASGESGFIIRTEKPLSTENRDALRGALEAEALGIEAFEVTGGVEEAKRLIGGTAQLVFKERECLVTLEELQVNPLLCQPVEQGGAGRFVDTDLGLTGEDLSRASPGRDPTTNAPLVQIEFRSRGADIFANLTSRIAGDELRRIAIFLDEEQISAPVVRSPILGGSGVIEGGFTRETSRTLAIQLESGRLPVPLTLIREGTVGALLGADSLRKSLIAGIVGLGLVLLFMVAYYRMAGVVAATALIIYAIIFLAILKLVPITLILSGIAGLVLSVGMAVDANVLIFERMKEEMRTGRTLTSAMEVGFRRAWPAIRDSNISTMIICAILFLFGSRLGGGTPVVTGFAVTLLIGVMVSMFTALMVSRNMLQILALTPIGKRMALFTPEPRRQPVGVAGGGK